VSAISFEKLATAAASVLNIWNRWDEEKGIDRPRKIALDGRDRIDILKRIAFKVKSRHVQEHRALTNCLDAKLC